MKMFKFLLVYSLLFFFHNNSQASDDAHDFLKQRNDEIFSLRQGLPDKNYEQQLNTLKDETLNRATGNGYSINFNKRASLQTQDKMRKIIHQSVTNDQFNSSDKSIISTTSNQSYLENSNYIPHLTWIVANYVKSWSMVINPSLCLDEAVGNNIYTHRMNVFKERVCIHNKSIRKQVKNHLQNCDNLSFAKTIDAENVKTIHADLSRNMPDVDQRTQDYIYVRDIGKNGSIPSKEQYQFTERNVFYKSRGIIRRNTKDNRRIVEIPFCDLDKYRVEKIIYQNKIYISYDDFGYKYDCISELPTEILNLFFKYLKSDIRSFLNLRRASKDFSHASTLISIDSLKENFGEYISKFKWKQLIKKMYPFKFMSKGHFKKLKKVEEKLGNIFQENFYEVVYSPEQYSYLLKEKLSIKNLIHYMNLNYNKDNSLWGKYFDEYRHIRYYNIHQTCFNCLQLFDKYNLNDKSFKLQYYINFAHMLIYEYNFEVISYKFNDAKSEFIRKKNHFQPTLERKNSKQEKIQYDRLKESLINDFSHDVLLKDNLEIQRLLAILYYVNEDFEKAKSILSTSKHVRNEISQHLYKLIKIENDLTQAKVETYWQYRDYNDDLKNYSVLDKWMRSKHMNYIDHVLLDLTSIRAYIITSRWLNKNFRPEFEKALKQYTPYAKSWLIKYLNDREPSDDVKENVEKVLEILSQNDISTTNPQ